MRPDKSRLSERTIPEHKRKNVPHLSLARNCLHMQSAEAVGNSIIVWAIKLIELAGTVRCRTSTMFAWPHRKSSITSDGWAILCEMMRNDLFSSPALTFLWQLCWVIGNTCALHKFQVKIFRTILIDPCAWKCFRKAEDMARNVLAYQRHFRVVLCFALVFDGTYPKLMFRYANQVFHVSHVLASHLSQSHGIWKKSRNTERPKMHKNPDRSGALSN